jgi:homoserine O-acetyltransferase
MFRALSPFVFAVAIGGCGVPPATPTAAPAPTSAPHVASSSSSDDPGLKLAELGTCRLDSGETIEDCRIGYRTFGTLDASRSNVVLMPTWFTGTSKNLEKRAPGGYVDTKRFFLVLVDSLGNGVSSSPSNSKKQPRLSFPRFTIHDMVETQRRLLREKLGVEKLHAVIGISMGGMQTFEWVVAHPDEVERYVPIVGSPQMSAQDLLLWNAELHVLEGSIAYAHGDYQGHPPIPGLQELHWLNLSTPDGRNAEVTRAAYAAWVRPKADDASFDWNDWHRQLEAMIAQDVARADGGDLAAAARRVKAKGLVVVGERDLMVNPSSAKVFAKEAGAKLAAYDDPCGHGLPSCEPALTDQVRAFLSN